MKVTDVIASLELDHGVRAATISEILEIPEPHFLEIRAGKRQPTPTQEVKLARLHSTLSQN